MQKLQNKGGKAGAVLWKQKGVPWGRGRVLKGREVGREDPRKEIDQVMLGMYMNRSW